MWPIRRPHSPDGQEMWQLKLADSQCSRETHACTSRSQSRPPSHSSCALSLVWAGWVPTGCAALVPPHSPAEPRHPARYVKVMQVLCNLVCTDCCWNEVFMLSLIVVAHSLAMQKMVTRSNSMLYLEGLSKFFLFLLKPLLGFLQFMCREATLAQLTLKVTHFLCWENRENSLESDCGNYNNPALCTSQKLLHGVFQLHCDIRSTPSQLLLNTGLT